MQYVDGYVLPCPSDKLDAYLKMARGASEIWREHGALEYRECVGDDLQTKHGTPFQKRVKAKRGEVIVFSWIVYKSRAHRDKVNAKVMKDPDLICDPNNMPFDFKRMAYGGFEVLVEF